MSDVLVTLGYNVREKLSFWSWEVMQDTAEAKWSIVYLELLIPKVASLSLGTFLNHSFPGLASTLTMEIFGAEMLITDPLMKHPLILKLSNTRVAPDT